MQNEIKIDMIAQQAMDHLETNEDQTVSKGSMPLESESQTLFKIQKIEKQNQRNEVGVTELKT
jgi:hypothetical protein